MNSLSKSFSLLILTLAVLLASSSIPLLTVAQPESTNAPTILGPLDISSAGDYENFVNISSPTDQGEYVNPVQLTFNTQIMTLIEHSYDVGYSLDNRVVNNLDGSVRGAFDNNGTEDWYIYRTTYAGAISLPARSEGFHTITVYAGYQYTGINTRFEVEAYSTTNFVVTTPTPSPTSNPTLTPAPTPTPTTTSTASFGIITLYQSAIVILVILLPIVAVISILLYRRHRR